jgi:trimeric autotransporter adhesin
MKKVRIISINGHVIALAGVLTLIVGPLDAFQQIGLSQLPILPNTQLLNSSVTIGSTNIALGATASSLSGLASVTTTGSVSAASVATTNTGAAQVSGQSWGVNGNGSIYTYGIVGHAGTGGTLNSDNFFNLYWTGSCAQFWVDTSNQGCVTFSSDRRLKKNFHNLGDNEGLSAIMRLNPVSFNWKYDEDQSVQYGFVAQDVQKVLPHLVFNTGMNEHNRTPGGMLKIKYEELTAPLIKAVQEEQEEIVELRKEIERLKRH